MLNYVHDIPTKIYFGKGQICHLKEEMDRFGKRVLLSYGGGSVKKNGVYDQIMEILRDGGFSVTEFSGIEPNPHLETVEKGIELCMENDIDVILAVGGGSTIDCSKAVAAGRYFEGDDLWEKIRKGGFRGEKALPLIAVLTISATGSEFDGGGVITNPAVHEKRGALFTYPTVSICDPEYTYSLPPFQTASGAADIMSHVFEEYISSTYDFDLSQGIAETILRSVIRNLPIALAEPDNYEARANLMADSSVACSGIPRYGMEPTGWPCHELQHTLGSFYNLTHGAALSVLTPHWMRYIINKDPDTAVKRFSRFARNVWDLEGEDSVELALAGVEKLAEFFRNAGLPATLREMGVDEEYLDEMSEMASSGRLAQNSFVSLTKEDCRAIYLASLG